MGRPRKTQGAETDETLTAEQTLMAVLHKMAVALERIETKLSPPEKTKVEVPAVQIAKGFPIPTEYQELVHSLLNKKFGVEIDYKPDTASFEFSILVPKEYSNAGASHWETFKEDRRSKVIENAYGANGVRLWIEQVYSNFNEETKSAITYDRAQL